MLKGVKAWLQDYLNMHRSERKGLLVLLAFTLLMLFGQYTLHFFIKPKPADFTEIQKLAEVFSENISLAETDADAATFLQMEKPANTNFHLFPFNPNNLTEQGFIRLGLPAYTARNIIKYRQKGGSFKTAEDFRKIYGLTEDKYNELLPYIQLPKNASGYENNYADKKTAVPKGATKAEKLVLNLNIADSFALLEVKGIGPAFASRIIKYRNVLGGFIYKEQLLEVYGMDSQRYEQLAPQFITEPAEITRININNADYKQLSRHPYISSKHANLIIQYRSKHGYYSSPESLKAIYGIDEKSLERMLPYLSVGN